MGYVTKGQALLAADRVLTGTFQDAKRLLSESTNTSSTSFDIFLSHSIMDAKHVLGAKRILEEKGFSVYVDWVEDPKLDRSRVNKRTADYLRQRMRQCSLLFYLHSTNSRLSKWCPWELGYFDGHSGSEDRTFTFPLVSAGESFRGQEYLELYPIVDVDNVGQVSRQKEDVWGRFPASGREWRQMSSILESAR